jgi:hypothetical protein
MSGGSAKNSQLLSYRGRGILAVVFVVPELLPKHGVATVARNVSLDCPILRAMAPDWPWLKPLSFSTVRTDDCPISMYAVCSHGAVMGAGKTLNVPG